MDFTWSYFFLSLKIIVSNLSLRKPTRRLPSYPNLFHVRITSRPCPLGGGSSKEQVSQHLSSTTLFLAFCCFWWCFFQRFPFVCWASMSYGMVAQIWRRSVLLVGLWIHRCSWLLWVSFAFLDDRTNHCILTVAVLLSLCCWFRRLFCVCGLVVLLLLFVWFGSPVVFCFVVLRCLWRFGFVFILLFDTRFGDLDLYSFCSGFLLVTQKPKGSRSVNSKGSS